MLLHSCACIRYDNFNGKRAIRMNTRLYYISHVSTGRKSSAPKVKCCVQYTAAAAAGLFTHNTRGARAKQPPAAAWRERARRQRRRSSENTNRRRRRSILDGLSICRVAEKETDRAREVDVCMRARSGVCCTCTQNIYICGYPTFH